MGSGAVPAIPTNASPGTTSSPGSLLSSRTVTLTWSASSGATIYDYGISDVTANPSNPPLVVDTTTTGTTATHTLAAGRQYRWNVRACNGSVSTSTCSGFTTLLNFQTP